MYQAYLERNAFKSAYFTDQPKEDLGLVVVIPAHNEKSLLPSLKSLSACDKPLKSVEVIVVFNASDQADRNIVIQNKLAYNELKTWYNQKAEPSFNLWLMEENMLPSKQAGVGLARKIGMDEAIRRFDAVNSAKGIVLCFDADSLCERNYLKEVELHFSANPNATACSIHFEHPLEGEEFEKEIYQGILHYEMHLRYYKNGLAYANLPFAYHTIGSSMAVRADAYCKEGGMNRRKAGEDFYFLQKFISNDQFSELNSTCVIPSPRASNRVPFGTGRAIQEMLDSERNIEFSYDFRVFEILKSSFTGVSTWFKSQANPEPMLLEFVGDKIFLEKLEEIRSQSTSSDGFTKRFFQWFNAFKTLKYVHYLRDKYFSPKPLVEEVPKLLFSLGTETSDESPKALLNTLRYLDRK